MFVVYENATKNDKPLKRLFKFKEGVNVRNGLFKVKMDETAPKFISLTVHTKQKVYASELPLEILDEHGNILLSSKDKRRNGWAVKLTQRV